MAVIYFIRDPIAKAVKVGYSVEPPKRLGGLQTGNPRPLTMIGTLPGGRVEEAALHRHFAPFHIRREWFRADDEILRQIGLMLIRGGKPATVWEECQLRGDCRYGLRDVKVAVFGSDDIYRVYGSQWDAKRRLTLDLFPDDGPEPRELWAKPSTPGPLVVRCLADFIGINWPIGSLHHVFASDCVLLSDWPCVCCRPGDTTS